MIKGLLFKITSLVVIAGTFEVQAGCTSSPSCSSLGYKYSASDCPNGGIKCPFDTSKYFCFSTASCFYTQTEASCAAQCRYTSGSPCKRNGTSYYKTCGSSKCSSGQTCSNGTCKSNMTGQYFYCCDDVGYGCSGYYSRCKRYTSYGDCSDVVASKKAQGCSPVLQVCGTFDEDYYENVFATFRCE